MTKLKKEDLLIGAYYSNLNRCSQIDEIFKYIDDKGEILTDNLNDIQIDFLKEEIANFKTSFLKLKYRTLDENDFYRIFDKMIECFYKEFNIKHYKKPKITIVDKFPHPFEDRNYKAMTFNKTHEKQFKIAEGIYILKKYAIHGISEIMIAHEIMHYIQSYFTPENEQLKQCPFLVEGIVDFFSLYLLMKHKIIDDICIKNWLSFGRGNCSEDYIGSLYFKQSKQICLIAKTAGANKVKNLVKSGDKCLSKLDLNEFCNLPTKFSKDKTMQKLLSFYDLVFSNFVLTSEEFCLFKSTLNLFEGKNSSKLKTIFPKKQLTTLLNSLQKKGLVYLLDDIVYNTNSSVLKTIKISLF